MYRCCICVVTTPSMHPTPANETLIFETNIQTVRQYLFRSWQDLDCSIFKPWRLGSWASRPRILRVRIYNPLKYGWKNASVKRYEPNSQTLSTNFHPLQDDDLSCTSVQEVGRSPGIMRKQSGGELRIGESELKSVIGFDGRGTCAASRLPTMLLCVLLF